MFDRIDQSRVAAMTTQEKRWLDNIKKAFSESDAAFQAGNPEDRSLEELFKAIDTAKTLRRSLRGEGISHKHHRTSFIEFLGLEIPAARAGGPEIELREAESGTLQKYTFGEVIYAIRCKVHENENLNAAEGVDYHILLDWSAKKPRCLGVVKDGRFICNGWFLWDRLRQVLAKFITCIDGMIAAAKGEGFSVTICPPIGSIRPMQRKSADRHEGQQPPYNWTSRVKED